MSRRDKKRKKIGFFRILRKINNIVDAFEIAKDIILYIKKTAKDPELLKLANRLSEEINEIAAK